MRTNTWLYSSSYKVLVSSLFFWLFLALLEITFAVILSSFPAPFGRSAIPSFIDVRSFIAALSLYALISIPVGVILLVCEKVFHWLKGNTTTSFFDLNRMDFLLLLGWVLLFFKLISHLIPFLKIARHYIILPYVLLLPLFLLQMCLSKLLKNKRLYYQVQWILIITAGVFLSKTAGEMLVISSLSLFVKFCLVIVMLASASLIGLLFYSLLQRIIANQITLRRPYSLLCIILLSIGVAYTLTTFYAPNHTFPFSEKPITSHTAKNDIAKNVIVIVVDCLRPDHLGCYGYSKNTSPFLDTIAQSATVFDNCIAPSSWTMPSVVSLFTGVYPKQHGVEVFGTSIPKEFPTLQTILKKQGVTTAAFITNAYLMPQFGYADGFHYYFDHYLQNDFSELVASRLFFFNALLHFKNMLLYPSQMELASNPWWSFGIPPFNHEKKSAERVTDDVVEWIDYHHSTPFYMYVHYMDVHGPYDDKWYQPYNSLAYPSQNIKEKLINNYDGRIVYLDKQLNRIWQYLQDSHLSKNTLLIITADHGEELYDHNRTGHCKTLYEELIQVPLIIVNDSLSKTGKRITTQVQLIDLPTTVLEFLTIAAPEHLGGQSMLPLILDNPQRYKPTHALSHTTKGQRMTTTSGTAAPLIKNNSQMGVTLQSLRVDNNWKIIVGDDGRIELYDLKKDAKELNNLVYNERYRANIVQEIKNILGGELLKIESPPPPQKEKMHVSPDVRNKLRALGYLD